jgi:hypothetical protein
MHARALQEATHAPAARPVGVGSKESQMQSWREGDNDATSAGSVWKMDADEARRLQVEALLSHKLRW